MDDGIISPLAYKKAILHCAKHPTSDILGVFIGEDTAEDAIPLFHNRITTPILEVALQLLNNRPILGFYESRIRGADEYNEPSPLIKKLVEGLVKRGAKKIYVLTIDCDWQESQPFGLYRNEGARVNLLKVNCRPSSLSEELKASVLSDPKIVDIVDMDDHLSDSSLDFNNSHIS